jgi:Protein of unknown function (DUF1302)
MRRAHHATKWLLPIAALLLFTVQARAQIQEGPLEISGQYQYIIDSNDGHLNPNNSGLTANAGNPSFNLMEQFAQLRINGTINSHWSFFLEPQLRNDLTKSVDSHWIQYESSPADYRGDGYLMRAGANDFKAELWEGYLDYRSGNLWLRAGKQSVAWGEDLALRILDQVDALDLSSIFFFGRGFEEFNQQRIPELGLRADYTIPNSVVPDLTIDTFVSPGTWTPTILPAQGAPFNVVPSILLYREDARQGRPIAAARLSGTSANIEWSLNALTRPSLGGVGIVKGLVADKNGGAPLLAAFNNFTLFRLFTSGEHPRFWLFGGSANYPWDWAGALLRVETAVVPDSPFTYPDAARIIDRPVWSTMFAVDRPTYLIPGMASLFASLQFEEIYTAGGLHHVQSNGVNVDPSVELVTLFFQQPVYRSTIDLEMLGVVDMAGGHWLQPGAHWQIGNNYALDIYYNTFGGSKSSRFPASFWWADGAWARATLQF